MWVRMIFEFSQIDSFKIRDFRLERGAKLLYFAEIFSWDHSVFSYSIFSQPFVHPFYNTSCLYRVSSDYSRGRIVRLIKVTFPSRIPSGVYAQLIVECVLDNAPRAQLRVSAMSQRVVLDTIGRGYWFSGGN